MLQKMRDNMKGSVIAVIVFLFFIVPLVLTGLGDGSFLGSVAGTDAASVEGREISRAELQRAIYMRKQGLLGQEGVDPNADYLKDENLRGPVLDNLTRRVALLVSAEEGGIGVSGARLDDQIRDRTEFHVDGKFDRQTYQRLLANYAYTPTTFKKAIAEDSILSQQAQGINISAFATEDELSKLVALVQQKRSFYMVKVAKDLVKDSITVSDEDVAAYYEENKSKFLDEENMTVEYMELSVEEISKTVDISDDAVKEAYENELKDFEVNEEFEIAHLLIEEKDDQEKMVTEVKSKLEEGVEFEALVKEYSDDVGSKDSDGNLGVLLKGVFPEAFEQAVYTLDQGQVSDAVTTDAGIHFIKLVKKTVSEAPSFENRKDAILASLKKNEAEEIYVNNLEKMEELTFSADNLDEAAKALGVEVKVTSAFTRSQGTGIASNKELRDTAFSDEVLKNDYNSKRIQIAETQSVVIRKANHNPDRIKGLDEVKDQITQTVKDTKINDELETLSAAIKENIEAGQDAETLAKEKEHEFKTFDKVERSSSEAGFQVANKAFSMSLAKEGVATDTLVDRDGNHIVVGLLEVVPGTRSDMEDQQYKGLVTQIKIQNANIESALYESQVVKGSNISIY